jgi:hypothetical protein
MISFSVFLGIDQTGAQVFRGQKAKPLKVCLVQRRKQGWQVWTRDLSGKPLTLKSVTPSEIKNLLNQFEIPWPKNRLAILADCVLGLPQEVFPSESRGSSLENLWALFLQTLNHSHEGNLFGLKVSESFFQKILAVKDRIPKRYCEEISGSNSVFTTRPYQKNIQTGSYRIWRDLVTESSSPWLNVWPFVTPQDSLPGLPWIFEGYPSFFWSHFFNLSSRNSRSLLTQLKSDNELQHFHFDSFDSLKDDPDLCDATVLAMSGILLQQRGLLLTPFPGFWNLQKLRTEGWIAGIELDLSKPKQIGAGHGARTRDLLLGKETL